MPRPAFILVHPGSLAAHAGGHALADAIRELELHDGPVVVIDGFLSDKVAPFEDRLVRAFDATQAKGEIALRLWGCDGGEKPYEGWKGHASPGAAIDLVHGDQEVAARKLAPLLRSRAAILSGAWASRSGNSGCVNSVADALKQAGWPGRYEISDTALFEDDIEE